MKLHSVLVFTLCITSAFSEDSSIIPEGVGDVIKLFNECQSLEGLSPCLKMKALTLIDRVSRMEKITLMDGVEIQGKSEESSNEPSLEEVEKTLPRSIDAKDETLTNMIVNKVAKMIGSRTIEISVPTLVESARKKQSGGGLFEKFGGGGDSGGGGSQKKEKKSQKHGMGFMQHFASNLISKKLSMIPLFIGALKILALKALITAKAALLIVGIIIASKLLHNKHQSEGHSVHHISAGHGGHGGHGGWSGGGGGGGWEGGWDRRSINEAQNLAFKSQKPT